MALTTEEQSFLNTFLEYHKEVTSRFDKLEKLIGELNDKHSLLNTKQAILESENTRVAIEKLSERYYAIDKRMLLLETNLTDSKEFQESVKKELGEIRAGMLPADDIKLLKKAKPFIYIFAGLFTLFEVWQVVKDFIKIP